MVRACCKKECKEYHQYLKKLEHLVFYAVALSIALIALFLSTIKLHCSEEQIMLYIVITWIIGSIFIIIHSTKYCLNSAETFWMILLSHLTASSLFFSKLFVDIYIDKEVPIKRRKKI